MDGINRYTCQCVPGYTGIHCEININDCASDPCANGGVCMDLVNGYKCECPRGYYDARCLSDVDECASNPCVNGGRCEDGVNQFICHCPPGYGGKRCEVDIDECGSNPCQHGGTCRDALNSYTCTCMPGYTGLNCEINIDDCLHNPCKNGGTCIDLVNGYKCVCRVSFTGRDCDYKMDPCQPNRCHNKAKCTPTSNYLDFTCTCADGYTGRLCEQDINECDLSSPCRNGATCRNIPGSYQCICAKGYEGRDCTVNTDDCAESPCQNGGTCLDGTGDYTCLCLDGFEGKNCQVDINECLSYPCQNGATCNQYVNSYTCTCPLGFSGMNCQINDEDCTDSSCMNGGTCIDGINSYNCSCQTGFTGQNCQYKINKCDSQPCRNGATCHEYNNDYTCICPYGYRGKQCTEFVDWCSQNPCENGASCTQNENMFRCRCGHGWTGKLCDVEMVSCKDAAFRKNVPLSTLCNNGTCEDFGNSHKCHCLQGYTGSYCQREINECDSSPCQNNGVCKDLIGMYKCTCAPGFQGQNCELNIDDCKPNPCQNGGTCHDLVNNYGCSCPPGTLGLLCDINLDDCVPNACHNNGTCVDRVGGYDCACPPGFVGSRCEGDINECLSNPCSTPGTLDCVQLVNDYNCNCKTGYMGRHCEVKVDFCANSPCQNGGQCSTKQTGHHCLCRDGFYGKNCEFSGNDCDSSPCLKGICHVQNNGGYSCECPFGTSGNNCERDTYDECNPNPCKRGAACEDKLADFECFCPEKWSGKTCEVFDLYYKGWSRENAANGLRPSQKVDLERQMEQCERRNCATKRGDRKCDEECNTFACNFDGGDCSLGINPWSNCTASIRCWDVFANGVCNEECNNAQCLFDGRDCERKLESCNPVYEGYCQKHYGNGHCDYGCNNAACNWDGLDCVDGPSQLAEGVISIVLQTDAAEFKKGTVAFLRYMGELLRTTVRIKKDAFGNDMIYPWNRRTELPGIADSEFGRKHNIEFVERIGNTGIQVYLVIDNSRCESEKGFECFQTAQDAAGFLGAVASKHTMSASFPILQVRGMNTPGDDIGDSPANGKYVALGAVLVLMACFLIGVLVTAKRKRAYGQIWTPEGFFINARARPRRKPDGQEMSNFNINGGSIGCMDSQMGHSQQWSDDESQKPKRRRNCEQDYSDGMTEYEEAGPKAWSQQHLAAAMHISSAIMTPPSHLDGNNSDPNVRGPLGMTPLMVAAMHGIAIDTGEEIDGKDDSTVQAITDLVAQGADLNAVLEKSGEAALHLSARFARADAAKRLLDAGAEANLQDNSGRTPLHSAIAADARGVFQILLRNRATNLNSRQHDGTTPLILAARLAIEGMVEDLINADADINAADNSGKTALHWAAAVNNVDAVNILLMRHANRDAQDDKEETPLFLAAREGAYEACEALLNNYANREITDHMDRTPRDVAAARQHADITRLMDDHVPRSPQMMTVMPTAMITPQACPSQILQQPTVISVPAHNKQTKQKPKRPKTNSEPLSPEGEKSLKRKGSAKKSATSMAKKVNAQILPDLQMTPDGTLSTANSPLANLPSPYDSASLYSNTLNAQHNMEMMPAKQPPSYEDCIKVSASLYLLSLIVPSFTHSLILINVSYFIFYFCSVHAECSIDAVNTQRQL